MLTSVEEADVVVIGSRLGGCAVSASLARAGRRVLVLDKMSFPSDQLSTHLLMPGGVSEFAKMGALPRILNVNPSQVRYTRVEAEGIGCYERLRPADDGVDFGVCIPRDLQDICLVEAAREQGVDVRERCTFQALHWRAGRVSGVRYTDPEGQERDIMATLVVGADGRRSNVAAAVGAWAPYRMSRNGRGLVFRYLDDPRAGQTPECQTFYQWRDGLSFAFAFPSAPEGRMLVLFMGHRDEASESRTDPEAYWRRKLEEHPGLRARIEGVDPASYTKIRSTGDCSAFFRASSGPGWALVGDAAHFKDPVTGQGMRDAMWMGRTLAEHVLPVLDDPSALDAAARRWEAHRDRHCLPAYHFANLDTRVEIQSPALCELVRDAGRTTDPDITDLFGRARTLQEIAPLPRLAKCVGMALIHGERPRSETLARALPELRTELEIRRERLEGAFRQTRHVYGSDHPDPVLPAAPKVTAVHPAAIQAPAQAEAVAA
ncbi:MAG TPA: FAD-dependent monooxygenase [Solirubrobacteraceae bacterium]|nr:FAD-dependent monooxygenase [Solirubrobacteraceae bacterium]